MLTCDGPGESGNTPGFSEAAALEGVEGCLVAGAEVDARGVDGGPPCASCSRSGQQGQHSLGLRPRQRNPR